jgi:hypothetical protein
MRSVFCPGAPPPIEGKRRKRGKAQSQISLTNHGLFVRIDKSAGESSRGDFAIFLSNRTAFRGAVLLKTIEEG